MEESILNSVKLSLGIQPDYNFFDSQLVILINTVFAILTQLGVGPTTGFTINDEYTTWSSYVPNDETLLSLVKTYVNHRVKLMFDSPSNSYTINAYEQQFKELEWRIQAIVDYNKEG